MTTKRKPRKASKPRTIRTRHVFGRRRFVDGGKTYVIEMRPDGLHVRELFCKLVRNRVTLQQVVDFSDPQLLLISAHGEGIPEGERLVKTETKEANGYQETRQDTKDTKDTETSQTAQAAGPA